MAAAHPKWARELKNLREQVGLSRAALARRCSIPRDTLRRWEDGTRRPQEFRLRRLLDELKATGVSANQILEGAGYRAEPTLFPNWRYPSYFYSLDELPEVVEQVPWPEFVLDTNVQVIAANAAIQAVWGVDFELERSRRTRAQMNMLSVASDHHFVDHLANWDEAIGVIASVFKGQPRDPESLEDPSAYFNAVLAEFAGGDPAYLARFLKIFAEAPAREPKCRWTYRVVWRDDEFGEMRFLGVVSTASEPGGLGFNDWHPLDADTWLALEQIRSRSVT
jgi:transcriptional regulator with XRE-family HTH domain